MSSGFGRDEEDVVGQLNRADIVVAGSGAGGDITMKDCTPTPSGVKMGGCWE